MGTRSLTKDFHRLQKNISSFSNDEARIIDFNDDLSRFEVELRVKDGFYKDGLFLVDVFPSDYPQQAPEVEFKTQIFHPNIGDGFDHDTVCFNLLDEIWTQNNDLEDVVQGLLFLVKNPNLDDPLNAVVASTEFSWLDVEAHMQQFANNVRKSLEGGNVEGMYFERNPGLGPAVEKVVTSQELAEICEESQESNLEASLNHIENVNAECALALRGSQECSKLSVGLMFGISWKAFRDEWNPEFFHKDGRGEENRFAASNREVNNWLVRLLSVLGDSANSGNKRGPADLKTVRNFVWNCRLANCLHRALRWKKR